MLASQNGHAEIVKSLINAKAQIELHQNASIVRMAGYLQILRKNNVPSFNELQF